MNVNNHRLKLHFFPTDSRGRLAAAQWPLLTLKKQEKNTSTVHKLVSFPVGQNVLIVNRAYILIFLVHVMPKAKAKVTYV